MSVFRKIRQRILTPPMSAASVARRGFYAKSPAAVLLLETIGQSFLTGYGYAAGSATVAETEGMLETVPRYFRGFAYEGAAMGFAMLDGLRLASGNRLSTFIGGR
jgi:enediyne biosynthesis protein E3